MRENKYFQKTIVFVLSLIVFAAACQQKAAENSDELLKKDGQALLKLNEIAVSLKANRLTSEDFEDLKKIREKHPDSAQVRQIYFNALVLRNDWLSVIELLTADNSKELSPEEKAVLARAHYNLGEYQKAIDILESLPQPTIETKSFLGQAYFQAGQTDKAAGLLEEIKPQIIEQKRAADLAVLGLVYLRQNDLEKAAEVLHKATEIAPDDIASNNALSLVYARRGDRQNAEKYRRKTVELQDKATAETFRKSQKVQKFYEIEKAWTAKNYDQVIKLAEEALTLTAEKNEKLTIYQYLFESHKALGNQKEAENWLAEAKTLGQQQ